MRELTPDYCPLSDIGHKYFIYKTYETYEQTKYKTSDGTPLYQKVEYASLGCNCSSVVRRRIKYES